MDPVMAIRTAATYNTCQGLADGPLRLPASVTRT